MLIWTAAAGVARREHWITNSGTRIATPIKSLKVRFNSSLVFHRDHEIESCNVPAITPQQHGSASFSARQVEENRIKNSRRREGAQLEYQLFSNMREELCQLGRSAHAVAIATLDVICGLARRRAFLL